MTHDDQVPAPSGAKHNMTRRLAPSEVNDEPWVFCCAPGSSDGCARVGKWMVFASQKNHDEVWRKIRDATEAGELGIEAKAATAMQNQRGERSHARLTCVYTRDYTELNDVRRVLVALRRLGVGSLLSYKEDEATAAGLYGAGAALYVAQADALDFEVRRRPGERDVIDSTQLERDEAADDTNLPGFEGWTDQGTPIQGDF